jgi:hypothetical protein
MHANNHNQSDDQIRSLVRTAAEAASIEPVPTINLAPVYRESNRRTQTVQRFAIVFGILALIAGPIAVFTQRSKPTTSTKVATSGGQKWVFPVEAPYTYVDTYGAPRMTGTKYAHPNQGADIFAKLGTPVVAVTSGTVFSIGVGELAGNRLWFKSDSGACFYYAHLSSFDKSLFEQKSVAAGAVLGFVGTTGNADGTPPHLHFETHPGCGGPVNPTPILKAIEEGHAERLPALLKPPPAAQLFEGWALPHKREFIIEGNAPQVMPLYAMRDGVIDSVTADDQTQPAESNTITIKTDQGDCITYPRVVGSERFSAFPPVVPGAAVKAGDQIGASEIVRSDSVTGQVPEDTLYTVETQEVRYSSRCETNVDILPIVAAIEARNLDALEPALYGQPSKLPTIPSALKFGSDGVFPLTQPEGTASSYTIETLPSGTIKVTTVSDQATLTYELPNQTEMRTAIVFPDNARAGEGGNKESLSVVGPRAWMTWIGTSLKNTVLAQDDGTGTPWRIAKRTDGSYDIMILGPHDISESDVIWIADTPVLILPMSGAEPIPVFTGATSHEVKALVGFNKDRLGVLVLKPGDKVCIGEESCDEPISVPAIAPWRTKKG